MKGMGLEMKKAEARAGKRRRSLRQRIVWEKVVGVS